MIEIIKFKFEDKRRINQAFDIRKKVFVIEQKCPPDIEYEYEDTSTHFLLTLNNNPICTARYRETENGMKLERFAVLKMHRGKGYGHQILKFMLNDLKKYQGDIYMHAQIDVIPFYEKLNFIKEGEKFEEAFIMHYKMKLKK